VSKKASKSERGFKFGVCAGAVLCLVSSGAFAQDPVSAVELISEDQKFNPLPLTQSETILAFDTAGSETQKLQLQLAEPLSLQATTQSRWLRRFFVGRHFSGMDGNREFGA
jgi:hypothetical protein